ncbi:MAG TPA: ATP-binding cassette domain-containing protein [Solirubrobacteraceae bacterium]|nr:ATP-binding cassette domain-containing protein [Solirubrobacteraceae bacterium]
MSTFIEFALVGLGTGGLYALLGQGIVLIYRASGVINFAQGAVAAVGGYFFYELTANHGWGWLPALVAAGVVGAVLGAAIQTCVMRPLRGSSALTRVIATTGVFTILVEIGFLRYGSDTVFVPPFLPDGSVSIGGGATVGVDRFILLGIGIGLTVVLWAVYRFTRFGLATSAVAENELTAGALGVSPDRVALVNWTVGSALAGVTGALISSIVALSPQTSALLVVPALAAAMIGGFRSFPLTLLGGLVIGVIEAELTNYVTAPGWAASTGFLVIAVWIIVRGQGLPLRGHLLERLPRVGMPRLGVPALTLGLLAGFVVIALGSHTTQDSMTLSMAYGFICLSLVLLTGYAGQISLAQFALAGVGALVAGRLSEAQHFAMVPAMVCGVLAAMGAGIVFGLPALRTRGISLAVVTLGLGLAFQNIVLGNDSYLGGINGTTIGSESIFGLDLNPIRHSARFAVMSVILLAAAMILVANLRRGSFGRRMLAVRGNERAAVALGIDVRAIKLAAFVISSGLAALGGILMAFQNPVVQFNQFNVVASIGALVQTVIIGIGFLQSAVVGGLGNPQGFPPQILNGLGNASDYVLLASGLLLLVTLVFAADGVAAKGNPLSPLIAIIDRRRAAAPVAEPAAPEPVQVRPAELDVEGVSVAFGGIAALRDVSMSVRTGEIVGLIGPNGAGKTTLIDVVSGITRASTGTIRFDGKTIERWRAYRRARAGLGRSFQALELFDDLTVRENLLVASERGTVTEYMGSLIHPGRKKLGPTALAAVHDLGLQQFLDKRPDTLSAGQRRLVGIARAVAASPSILLLDEPAAGLDENETRELGAVVVHLARRWGMGIALVEHDFSLVQAVCDRLVVLDHGAVLAEGSTADVTKREDVVEAFIGPTHKATVGAPEAAAFGSPS